MSKYQKEYEEKRKTPAELAGYVDSGDIIGGASSLCEPKAILAAICDRIMEEDLRDITYYKNWMIPSNLRYTEPEMEGRIKCVAYFLGSSEMRKMVPEGKADYVPGHLSQQSALWLKSNPKIVMAMASSMDEDGYFSFSINAIEGRTFAEMGAKVFLEVSPNMPYVHGDNKIHISEVTAFCESEVEPIELGATVPREEDIKIAEYIVDRVPDGACIQFGVGRIPDAVGSLLKEKRHLGIHTEMMCTSMYELIKAGAVDNSKKNIHPGKTAFAFCAGTREMYDYINNNPEVEGYESSHINDPFVIAQNDNVVSINACLEMDILGQVCSESVGPRRLTGTGGQLDFVRGAGASTGKSRFRAHERCGHGGYGIRCC